MASLPSTERIDRLGETDVSTILRPNDAVAEAQATEVEQLLGAYGALHRDGMLDGEEYEAKRLVLAERAARARRRREP